MKLRGRLPASLAVLMVGTALAWLFYRNGTSLLVPVGKLASDQVGLRLPIPAIGDLWHSLPYLLPYLPVTIPMGLLNLISSLRSIEFAAAAGNNFPGKPSLIMNGLGTLGAAICVFPTPPRSTMGIPPGRHWVHEQVTPRSMHFFHRDTSDRHIELHHLYRAD